MPVPIISVAEMRRLEQEARDAGRTDDAMVREAGSAVADWLLYDFPNATEFIFFCGRGANGRDGLRAAQVLASNGRATRLFTPYPGEVPGCEPLTRATITDRSSTVLVDALLGIGATGPLREELHAVTAMLQPGRSPVAAIDVPSGVNADTGEVDPHAVGADITISCGPVKRGLLRDAARDRVGRIRVCDIPFCNTARNDEDLVWFDLPDAQLLLPRRRWTAHKGTQGHAYVIAGNVGTSGAAVLTIQGALAAGAGLVTAFIPKSVYGLVASQCTEAMVHPVDHIESVLDEIPSGSPVVLGPGLGTSTEASNVLFRLLRNPQTPLILDADGLNLFAARHNLWGALRENVLLTPHPGEMQRMTGRALASRLDAAREFVTHCPAALALKGAGTIVAQHGQSLSVNASGNPGMATGGMGDLLAGICGGLVAQGLSVFDAARAGVFLHGLAADLALDEQSVETLLPRHVLARLGAAFRAVRA
jgi:NAD(P)H-hydrate epimerase